MGLLLWNSHNQRTAVGSILRHYWANFNKGCFIKFSSSLPTTGETTLLGLSISYWLAYGEENLDSGLDCTCESLSAGVYPSQPFGCAKIWYFQDATVGVDEYIITLWIEKTFIRTDAPNSKAVIALITWGACKSWNSRLQHHVWEEEEL